MDIFYSTLYNVIMNTPTKSRATSVAPNAPFKKVNPVYRSPIATRSNKIHGAPIKGVNPAFQSPVSTHKNAQDKKKAPPAPRKLFSKTMPVLSGMGINSNVKRRLFNQKNGMDVVDAYFY